MTEYKIKTSQFCIYTNGVGLIARAGGETKRKGCGQT